MKECKFCQLIDSWKNGDKSIYNKVLFSTPNFIVVPVLGAIVPGYIMIISKAHAPSMAYFEEVELQELHLLIERLKKVLSLIYGKPVLIFEHGSAIGRFDDAPNSIDHAHIHLLPISLNSYQEILDEIKPRPITSICDLKNYRDTPYLFLINEYNQMYLSSGIKLPSQYMRQWIAKDTGQTRKWDWRKYEFIDNMKKTVEDFVQFTEFESEGKDVGFIPSLIIESLKTRGIDYITSLPDSQFATIDDVINYCEKETRLNNKEPINFREIIKEIIADGYDLRYSKKDIENDERLYYQNEFIDTFHRGLLHFGITDYNSLNTLLVGVGTGVECDLLFNNCTAISMVDIAKKSLEKAKNKISNAKAFINDASDLHDIDTDSIDLYISLRTYMSTYFCISKSLEEAKRVLKDNGIIVISIACGYIDEAHNYEYGLYNPYTCTLEKKRPMLFVNTIINRITEKGFHETIIMESPTEIFIFSRLTQ